MLLYNPTKNKITVMIEGETYSINAEDSIEINDKLGLFWKTTLHNFLEIRKSIRPSAKETAPEVIEIPEESIVTREEMVADIGEEEVQKIEEEPEEVEAVAVITESVKKNK